MLPQTMKAIVTIGDGSFCLTQVNVPCPGAGEVLVKVVAVAQNPTDWKTLWNHQRPGNIIGCDFAGTVVDLGKNEHRQLWAVGARVAGVVHGGVSANGAFAEYVVVPAELLIGFPKEWSFEEAAQLGTACFTVCQSFYQCLHLPTPFEPAQAPIDILIWSGTSATGHYAVQFAKQAGLRVISTSSPKHFDYVKSIGADEVFDYADSYTPRKIVAATDGKLKYALDCISQGMTPNQVSNSLSKDGGTIATLLPYESRKRGVKTHFILTYTIFGKDLVVPSTVPRNMEHYNNAIEYAKLISKLLAKSMIKPTPMKIYSRGLASVAEGMEYMKAGTVHAEKITYRISDTPDI